MIIASLVLGTYFNIDFDGVFGTCDMNVILNWNPENVATRFGTCSPEQQLLLDTLALKQFEQ